MSTTATAIATATAATHLIVANITAPDTNDRGYVVTPLSPSEVDEIRRWPAPVAPEGGDAQPYWARTSTGRLIKVGYTMKGTPAATPVDLEGCHAVVWQ